MIEHSRSRLLLQDGRLAGEGLPALRALMAPTQFLLLGEDHLVSGIADFATALWQEAHGVGYRHAVLEADRWSVAELERRIAAGEALAPWLQAQGGGLAYPFYTLAPELRWLQAIVASQPAPKSARLWGVDQVFLGSVPIVLAPVAERARQPQARRLGRRGHRRLSRQHELAEQGLAGPAAGPAAAAWTPSASPICTRGCRPCSTRGRSISPSPAARAKPGAPTKRASRACAAISCAPTARPSAWKASAPKVLAKLGANHLYRGASTTWVQSFGNAMVELARSQERSSLSMLLLCAPGGQSGTFTGGEAPCNAARYGGDWAFIEPYLHADAITLFDLRSWRLRPGRFAHLPASVQRVVAGFDLLLFVPSGPPARYLDGLTPPRP